MAVAEGGNVDDQAHVEVGAAIHYGPAVLRHFFAQNLTAVVAGGEDGVEVAGPQAPAASHALIVVDGGFAIPAKGDGVVGALAGAGPAACTAGLVHVGLAAGVLFHLAGTASAAHAQVL